MADVDLKRLSAEQLQEKLEMQNRDLQESQFKLEESRARYTDLYDYAPISYITFDADGYIREVNLAGASLLGQERAHLLGKPFNQWLNREDSRAFTKHLKNAQQTKQVVNLELKLNIGEGRVLDACLETILLPQLVDGKSSCRSVVIDISAHKHVKEEVQHVERHLRLLGDVMQTYVSFVDVNERYEFVNKAFEELFQMPREQILGKTVRELVGEKGYADVAGYLHMALSGQVVNFEIAYAVPGGKERQFHASFSPDFSDDGTVLGCFNLVRDVTELQRREEQDRMHLLEMARVTRINTMGEMVAELAHELNQPLAAITIYSDAVKRMLSKGSPDIADMQKALDEIRLQAARAGDVIVRLREFVSKRELDHEDIHINSLINEVMKLIAVEARWHDVEVKLELGEDIPLINVDRILIEQVVLNLARNAIEAMDMIERDKRRLTIRTALGNYDEIEISVEDSGPGLSVDEIEKIFEPFYTSKPHGMGMGLAISRSIIKAHHGRLWAISNEHGGATFTIIMLHEPDIDENTRDHQ